MSAPDSADRHADVCCQHVRRDGSRTIHDCREYLNVIVYVKKYISACKFNEFLHKRNYTKHRLCYIFFGFLQVLQANEIQVTHS